MWGQAGNLFRVAELHPRLTAMDTEYGMVYGGRRRLPVKVCRSAVPGKMNLT